MDSLSLISAVVQTIKQHKDQKVHPSLSVTARSFLTSFKVILTRLFGLEMNTADFAVVLSFFLSDLYFIFPSLSRATDAPFQITLSQRDSRDEVLEWNALLIFTWLLLDAGTSLFESEIVRNELSNSIVSGSERGGSFISNLERHWVANSFSGQREAKWSRLNSQSTLKQCILLLVVWDRTQALFEETSIKCWKIVIELVPISLKLQDYKRWTKVRRIKH